MPIWKSFLGKNKGNMDLHSWKHSLKIVTLKSTVQVLSWIEASVILLLLGRPVWHCGNGFLELSLLLETGGALSSSCTCVNGLFFVQCHVRPVVPLWLEKDWVLRLWTMHFLRLARLFYYSSSCSLTCPQRFLLQRSFFFLSSHLTQRSETGQNLWIRITCLWLSLKSKTSWGCQKRSKTVFWQVPLLNSSLSSNTVFCK